MKGIRARPVRTTKRGQRKRVTAITFTLSARGRVIFVVRGPAPSCGVAGRFSVRGKRGVNHLRFTGRVGRRELADGTYRITARTRGRAPSRPVTVVVGSQPASSDFDCRSSWASEVFASVLAPYGSTFGSGTESRSSAGSATTGRPAPNGRGDDEPDSGVLPAVTERLRELPKALTTIPDDPTSAPWIIGAGALLLVALSLLALVAYVVRFLRGPRTI